MAAASATVLATERWARQPGYLQRLDARAKLIGFLALILVTALLRRPGPLLALYTLALVLALASRLPLGMLLKRVWLSVPLFVGALALPAALNIVTPGPAVLTFWSHPLVALTAPGLLTAGTLTLRVGVAVTLAALLALTTGGNDLLQAARALFVPRQIVLMMALTYRYLLLLLQTAAEMFLARRSRTVGRTTNAQGRQFVGSSIGALFGKTLALAEEVHAAMLSRGFTGEIRTLARRRWGAADTAWLLAVGLTAMLALNSPRLLP
jgi:cobalt ECF transporter T component CbiQ